MSQRHTWGQVKGTVAIPIGMAGDHPNLLPRANEAMQALWNEGDWVGKFERWKLRVCGEPHRPKFVTWPRWIETIEAAQWCHGHIGVREMFFEFVETATGDLDHRHWSGLLGDRQEVCSVDDIDADGQHKLTISISNAADAGVRVLLLGRDQEGRAIRTIQNGVTADGELLVCATSPVQTQNNFSALTGVQFLTPNRHGNFTLTQVSENSAQKILSVYESDEDVPVYRRSVLNGVKPEGETLLVLARMRYRPVRGDRDYLQIGSVTALSNMLIALQKRDNGLLQEYAAYQQLAVAALNSELRQFRGVGATRPVRVNPTVMGGRNLM